MNTFKFDKESDNLFKAILGLDTIKEAEKFFRDLCTAEEIKAMSERWQIARLLDQGIPYRQISEAVGASTTTVSRVAAWLNNGEGGYRLALDKAASHHNSSKVSRKS
jgi:TrpR-related protein YerC/YecD